MCLGTELGKRHLFLFVGEYGCWEGMRSFLDFVLLAGRTRRWRTMEVVSAQFRSGLRTHHNSRNPLREEHRDITSRRLADAETH